MDFFQMVVLPSKDDRSQLYPWTILIRKLNFLVPYRSISIHKPTSTLLTVFEPFNLYSVYFCFELAFLAVKNMGSLICEGKSNILFLFKYQLPETFSLKRALGGFFFLSFCFLISPPLFFLFGLDCYTENLFWTWSQRR